jgi:uncharacterized protein involved in exopolysaccharide biosynthesis/Mrp family chromosome partitioning ATPase
MLNYDAVPERAPASRRLATAGGEVAFSLLELLQLLWARKLLIVGAGLACALAALVVGKTLTPKYVATTQLYVDPRELQLVDRELAPRTQDASNLPMVVESQARLITSSSVLLRVVDSAHLTEDAEFGGPGGDGLLAGLLRSIGLRAPGAAAGADRDARDAALEQLARHVTVKRTDRTFIVDVDVWSKDPVKAARLANDVAAAYLAEANDVQSGSARRATQDLSSRLSELEQRLRNAENRVAAYKAENNFVGSQDTLVSDQQLSEMTAKLATARAATLDAQARYDQITENIRNSGDGGATSEALRSPTLASLRAQYAEARRRQAELTNELGPRHPAIRSMDTQVADLKKNINEEVARFAQAAKNDLSRARDYENGLARSFENLKRQSLGMTQASVRLRELERDVDASRAVYQSFLKRSRETEEQERLNTSTARITSEATIPQRRSFPPAMSVLMMLGLILGSGGTALAIVAIDRLQRLSIGGAARAPASAPATALAVAPAAARPVASDVPHVLLRQQAPPSVAPPAPALAPADRPLVLRLQSEEVYPRNADSPGVGAIDVNRIGWPTLRIGGSPGAFADAMRDIRFAATGRSIARHAPVLAVIGSRGQPERSVTALNVALAAAHDGFDVLLMDADFRRGDLSRRVEAFVVPPLSPADHLSPTGLGAPIETINNVTILPLARGGDPATMADAVRLIAEHARETTECGLIVLDGPVAPFGASDRDLVDFADGIIAALPGRLDIEQELDRLLDQLGDGAAKLLGVVINELESPGTGLMQEQAHA